MLWVPFWTGGIQRLNDDQLDVLSASIAPLFQYLEQEVITDIARRIKKTMTYTRTAELMAMEMQRLGYSPAKIRAEAMKRLQADVDYQNAVERNTIEYKQEIKKLIEKIVQQAVEAGNEIVANAGNMSWIDDMSLWESNGRKLGNNSFLHQLQDAFSKQTAESMKNLTRTTGFKTMSGYESVMNAYRNELDKAAIKICSGTFSQEMVIRDAIKNLSQSGLRSIDFASGRSMQLDTAVKLAVRTGCGQLAAKIHDQNILSTGQNLVYVSEHWGARNTGTGVDNHEKWQGRVYYIKPGNNYSTEAKRIGQDYIMDIWYATGYSPDDSHTNDPRGLHGYNCRHNHYVWFEGTSTLPDKNPQPGPVTIGGKTYDYYAMTQKMRAMERNIRALKREKEALQALGQPATEVKAKLSEKSREYRLFCKQCKIKENSTNLRYECGTADLNKTKAWKKHQELKSIEQNVEKCADHGIIKVAKEDKGVEVHTVGKINRNIYKCITEEIVTDEVIITDERIQHIKERHPNDYERYYGYLKAIVEDPQYIIETKKPDTAFILREFSEGTEQFKTVLRLVTAHDNPEYKNSIITFMRINDKEWNRLLRNKQILYKKE